MNVSIIIPSYNSAQMLKNNLPHVLAACKYYILTTGKDAEIITVDDCSTDNSLHIINDFKRIHNKISLQVITSNKNYGFSSSVNKGIKEAKFEIVVLLNTDVKPEKNFLQNLVKHFKNEEVFAVGCMDKSIENDSLVLRGRGLGRWKRGFLTHKRGNVNKPYTLWVSGGSSAFNKSIWKRLGGMHEIYDPFYWEDIDISYRALKAGYKIYFEKESIVTHLHDLGVIKNNYSAQQIKTVSYRNQIIFAWINMSDLDLIIKHIVWLPFNLLSALLRHDSAFLKGFIQALLKLNKIFKLRQFTQNLKNISDQAVINLILE